MNPYQVPVQYSDTPVHQIIKDRYIDQNKLETFLSQKFPPGTYSVEYRSERWVIIAPALLSKAELDYITI